MKAVVVLAAGRGTRMGGEIPKVLREVGGKPMLDWVIDAVGVLNPGQVVVVGSKELAETLLSSSFDIVTQVNPKGTGDALRVAYPKLDENVGEVFLVCGDTPFLDGNDLARLSESESDLALMVARVADLEKPYGRVEFDESGKPVRIIETKHNPAIKSNPIVNAGVYKFKKATLDKLLPKLKVNAESGEIYATDLLEMAVKSGFSVEAISGDEKNIMGVNTPHDLSRAEETFQREARAKFTRLGVSLRAPETCVFNHDTVIEGGATVEPYVVFGKNVRVRRSARVFSFCYLSDCLIEAKASVGPFARLRGETSIGENAQVGNFVEVKGSTFAKGAKAKHLAYIGDTSVGANGNIGAGVVTCNYNGFEKFKTVIGANVMVGGNATLIAPLTLNDDAYVAAGSVIAKDVAAGSLVVERGEQKEKLGWVAAFRARRKK